MPVRRALAALALVLAGCGDGGGPRVPAGPPPPPTPEREVAGVQLAPFSRGLKQPVQVLAGPRGALWVVERAGRIRALDARGRPSAPLLDLARRTRVDGEHGMLAVALGEGELFVHRSARSDGATLVERYPVAGGRPDAARGETLLRVEQPHDNHNGGGLAIGPDGRLYVGLGDGGGAFDSDDRAQDPGSPLGKLLALDIARPGARWDVVATGLRNPWRIAFDERTGDLWIGDVGQDRGEEVDRIPAARLAGGQPPNLGWPAFEGDERMPRRRLRAPSALLAPVAVYSHEPHCSISGGLVHRGGRPQALRGRYVFGDFCSGALWSIPAKAGRAERIDRERGVRLPGLVSFAAGHDGQLYVVSLIRGTVLRVEDRS